MHGGARKQAQIALAAKKAGATAADLAAFEHMQNVLAEEMVAVAAVVPPVVPVVVQAVPAAVVPAVGPAVVPAAVVPAGVEEAGTGSDDDDIFASAAVHRDARARAPRAARARAR